MNLDIEIAMEISSQIADQSSKSKSSKPGGIKGMMSRTSN